MKKTILFLAIVLSFAYTFGANQLVPKKTKINNIIYTEEKANQPINFKTYLLEDCCILNLTDYNIGETLLIDEELDEPLDFDHTKYLPIGFNPSKEFNTRYLNKIKWVDEEEATTLDFNHTKYLPVGFNPDKKLNHLFLNELPWVDEEELEEL